MHESYPIVRLILTGLLAASAYSFASTQGEAIFTVMEELDEEEEESKLNHLGSLIISISCTIPLLQEEMQKQPENGLLV